MSERPVIWMVLDLLEQNVEPVAGALYPQVSINVAVLALVDWGFVALTRAGPRVTRAGRLYARALRAA